MFLEPPPFSQGLGPSLCTVYIPLLESLLFTVVVHGGLYVIHSLDSPAYQNPRENLCWRITNGKLELARRCQVTIKNSKKAISQLQNLSL